MFACHKKYSIMFIIVFVLYCLCSLFVLQQTGVFIHLAIIWNLILAIIPMLFSYFFIQMMRKNKKIVATLCFICWLLFFPNVPYLITDFIHITPLTFYTITGYDTSYLQDIWVWIQLLNIGCGVLFGFFAGYVSLFNIQIYVKNRFHSLWSWGFVGVIALLSGFGIYIGRFLRLNSWDVLHPVALINKILIHMDASFAIPFTICIAIFIMITYTIFYVMFHHREVEANENIICK